MEKSQASFQRCSAPIQLLTSRAKTTSRVVLCKRRRWRFTVPRTAVTLQDDPALSAVEGSESSTAMQNAVRRSSPNASAEANLGFRGGEG